MQTYIGIFYHVLLHRNFMSLRQVLIQRLIISQVNKKHDEKLSFEDFSTLHMFDLSAGFLDFDGWFFALP